MLGWINKKIGTGAGGSAQGGSGGAGSDGTPAAGGGDGRNQHQHHRDMPPPLSRSLQARSRGSFLDAVGGAMGRNTRKKEEKSEAAALAEQLDAQRAEKISCVAFKLVREIQRILKEARETQAVAAANANAAAAAASAGRRTPAATPPTPSRKDGSGGGRPANTASAAASGVTKNRWAGTEELLALLDGGSPGGAGEVEDKVERFGSIAEVQAKMSDLVEQALVPESHGDLCGQLLEAACGDGHHPAFVKLCVDAGLPSNLVHCLRIMRVVEFESAMHESGSGNDNGGPGAAASEVGSFVTDDEGNPDTAGGSSTPRAAAAATRVATDRPQTKRATERIGRLLVKLCQDKSAGVGEQIKPHLPGLLSLAVSAYPVNGAHVQETARAVVEALMAGCLNSSMVWLLHYNKVSGGSRDFVCPWHAAYRCTKENRCSSR